MWRNHFISFFCSCVFSFLMAPTKAETLNDPTRPPEAIVQTLPEGVQASSLTPKLNGLKVDGKASFAIINDQLMRVGDKQNEYTLIKVSHDQAVLLDKNRHPLTLRLNIENFKKDSAPTVSKKAPKNMKKSAAK